jgi:hypothetical protein
MHAAHAQAQGARARAQARPAPSVAASRYERCTLKVALKSQCEI